jgi:hypothetical protein
MSALLGTLIQNGAKLGAYAQKNALGLPYQQEHVLHQLLHKARNTAFGRYYGFRQVLKANDPVHQFAMQVPAVDYNVMYDRWWQNAHLCDTPNVTWPGLTPYYALSSGTSQAATKYIPVTEDMLSAMKLGARKMFYDLTRFDLPASQYTRQMLMVGSCTQPKKEGRHFSGDLSGIIGRHRPVWMERYYRPGKDITNMPDWNDRIERIALDAPKWDIGFAISNPMWLQLILERIIEKHQLNHIHEIWPNFAMYVHGGVFFDPYRNSFEQLLGKQIQYVNSYMASEGLFSWSRNPNTSNMVLATDLGVFYEFVPFTSEYFDDNGDLRTDTPDTFTLRDVNEYTEYAMLISTCAGAWRYLLGDTIRFTNARAAEIKLTGRTKQHISVCGEHLSIDNLNEAVRRADQQLNAGIREFCVMGVRQDNHWAHQWYMSCDNKTVAPETIMKALDEALCDLNEDYAVERIYALKDVRLQLLPNHIFIDWLASKGKLNGQAKVPRVLKGGAADSFTQFLSTQRV